MRVVHDPRYQPLTPGSYLYIILDSVSVPVRAGFFELGPR
jgi:hypothetical protein